VECDEIFLCIDYPGEYWRSSGITSGLQAHRNRTQGIATFPALRIHIQIHKKHIFGARAILFGFQVPIRIDQKFIVYWFCKFVAIGTSDTGKNLSNTDTGTSEYRYIFVANLSEKILTDFFFCK
jgi:hypothetical protein